MRGGAQTEPRQDLAQRLARGRHDARVEGMTDRDAHRGHLGVVEASDRLLDGPRRAADHGLRRAVDVGNHDVTVDRVDDAFDLLERADHGRHCAVVLDLQACHLVAAGAHRLERVAEVEGVGGDQCAVLPETVAHYQVGLDAVRCQQAREREVGGQHGRLRDLGLLQLFFELRHRRRVGTVDEDELAERPAEQRCHDPVRVGEDGGDERLTLAQPGQHVDVLRALARVQERHLGRCAAPEEHTLRTQCPPHRRRVLSSAVRALATFCASSAASP